MFLEPTVMFNLLPNLEGSQHKGIHLASRFCLLACLFWLARGRIKNELSGFEATMSHFVKWPKAN